jgi:hypothetical protein
MSESEAKEYTSLRVEKGVVAEARDAKHEGETWSEFIRRCSDTRPEIVEYVKAGEIDVGTASVDVEELAAALSKKMGSDLELAAHRGASDALEEASR